MLDKINLDALSKIPASITSPFGLLSLIVLVLFFIISSKDDSFIYPAILFLYILCVFYIIYKKPRSLYPIKKEPKQQKTMTIVLQFPIDNSNEMEFKEDDCFFVVNDIANREKLKEKLNLKLGPGNQWFFNLNSDLEATDSVSVEIVENNGQMWVVKKFTPYSFTMNVYRKSI